MLRWRERGEADYKLIVNREEEREEKRSRLRYKN